MMKNKLTIQQRNNASFLRILPNDVVLLFLTFILVFSACKDTPKKEDIVTLVQGSPTYEAHVAFAGGGWRAHTAHSAWTISLLNTQNNRLENAFQNVRTFSSNSGGSWFSTMLMFSDQFNNDIQSPTAISDWTTSGGWIGKQSINFDQACKDNPIDCALSKKLGTYLEFVFDHYTKKDIVGGIYWKRVIENLVFKDYSLGTFDLKSNRAAWARDKSLLIASSLLTNTVVLNRRGEFSDAIRYYQVCRNPSQPVLHGDHQAGCTGGLLADVTPATFSSIPVGSGLKSPSFFAQLGSDQNTSIFNIGYSENYSGAPKITEQVSNPIRNNETPVMTAAAASSAAGGFLALEPLTGSFYASDEAREDALSFSLKNNTIEYTDVATKSLAELSSNKIVRLADGGPVDNSGVVQLMRFLQLNQKDQGFNIVAFDNVTSLSTQDQNLGPDLASLFGIPESFCASFLGENFCVRTPDLTIFDPSSLSTPVTWSTPLGKENMLIYTKYSVTTKGNDALGIAQGSKGYLHAFTCVYNAADTAPLTQDAFDAYAQMFRFINSSLITKGTDGLTGLDHLKAALGVQ